MINLKKRNLIAFGAATIVATLIFFFTPQERWVPVPIKQIVYSCYRENSYVPVIASNPQCCVGLKRIGITSKGSFLGEPLLGSTICLQQ